MRSKFLGAALAAVLTAGAVLPAAAAPFPAGGVTATAGVIAVDHRYHGDGAAAAAAVGVGAFALGLLAGSASRPPEVVYTPGPVYRPLPPTVVYRRAPRVYDCHIERTRVWDPYIRATIVRRERVCY